MSADTGDIRGAVEAAFSASSTPEPASTATVEPSAPSASETATTDVSQQAAPPPETTKAEPGPIPYTRFKEVNDKWTTANKELESLGWAKGVNPQLAQSAIQLLTRAQGNPLAFTEELEALRDHPEFGPQLRSWAARTLGTRVSSRPPEAGVDEGMPEPDLHFEDGRKSYTSEQLAKRDAWLLKQWESKIDERIAPIAKKGEAAEKYVAEQVYAGLKAQAEVTGKSEIDALAQQYPQFNEHRDDVRAVMEANPAYSLKQAWWEVYADKLGSKLAGQSAATVQKKVAAGSVNPARQNGSATAAPPSSIREHLELLMTGNSNA